MSLSSRGNCAKRTYSPARSCSGSAIGSALFELTLCIGLLMLGGAKGAQLPPGDENASHQHRRPRREDDTIPKSAASNGWVSPPIGPPPRAEPPPAAPPPAGPPAGFVSGLADKFTPRTRRKHLTATKMRLPLQSMDSPQRHPSARFKGTNLVFSSPFQKSPLAQRTSPLTAVTSPEPSQVSPAATAAPPKPEAATAPPQAATAPTATSPKPADPAAASPPTFREPRSGWLLSLLSVLLAVWLAAARRPVPEVSIGFVIPEEPPAQTCRNSRRNKAPTAPSPMPLSLPMPACQWNWRAFNCGDASPRCSFSLQRLVMPNRKACMYE